MSSLPPPEEVAGPYLPQYEVYYKKLDADGKGEIGAMDAASFLKKSGLPDDTLGKIWDLADPTGKGYLDKAGLFVACKMVALVQSDTPLTIDNARVQCPAPNFGADTAPGAPVAKVAPKKSGNVNFLVKPEEKRKYDALFDQLQPVDEKLPGDKVRQVMIGSKLAMPILGQIWDLSDVDRDGFLDRYEFTVAMHLVFRALQGDKVPADLPDELKPDLVPKPISAIPNLNGTPKPPGQPAQAPSIEAIPWVVNAGDRLRYTALFKQTDSDRDGFVSGIEIKNVFLQTGLPQNILAHIWNLCDIHQEGKLNPEQFALAMWLISRKQAGRDPPAALTPDMVPPTLRPKGQDAGKGGVYNNPELELMAKEIQSLLSEKIQLEKEIQETEYNITVKKTEMNSLQGEFDTLSSTLKQLTNQRDVAQKRLDELDVQKASIDVDLVRLLTKVEEENLKIEKLRKQAEDQETTLLAQEEEVHGKQKELDNLKDEEKKLLEEIKLSEKEIAKYSQDLDTATDINAEIKEQKQNLEEAVTHMEEALKQFKTYDETPDADPATVADLYLETLNLTLEMPDMSRLEKPKKPPVPQPPQMNGNGGGKGMFDSYNYDASHTPFGGVTPTAVTPGGEEPAPADAFANFDDFGFDSKPAVKDEDHPPPIAPRPDSGESPTPALPPKSSAAPPRRPPPPKRPPPPGGAPGAPGRPPPPPGASKNNDDDDDDDDPFGSNFEEEPKKNNGGSGFADFANFDSFEFPKFPTSTMSNALSAWPDSEDSAFGSSDPTPTHQHKSKSTLEFADDPFKDANHRYGDPFEIEGADPFTNEDNDPFTAPVDAAFGSTAKQPDFFAAAAPPEATFGFVSSSSTKKPGVAFSDPFASNWDDFDRKASVGVVASSSAWGGSKNNLDDSFDPFSAKNNAKKDEEDPFGAANSSWDPFNVPVMTGGVARSKTSSDAFADFRPALPPPNKSLSPLQKSETSHSLSRPRYSQQEASSNISRTRPSSSKGSPALTPEHDKKMKNNFKLSSLKGPFSRKKDKSVIQNDLGPSAPSSSPLGAVEDNHIKIASEASRRAERERLERLRIQEEKDLAYAIALSKAEASSLNNQ